MKVANEAKKHERKKRLRKKVKGRKKKKTATHQRKGQRCEGLGCGQLVAQQNKHHECAY
jgi:hypothetical protein